MLLISKVHISTIARLGALGAACSAGPRSVVSSRVTPPHRPSRMLTFICRWVPSDALERLAGAGVTVVRDCGGDMKQLTRWRDEIAAGTRRGPRFSCGPLAGRTQARRDVSSDDQDTGGRRARR